MLFVTGVDEVTNPFRLHESWVNCGGLVNSSKPKHVVTLYLFKGSHPSLAVLDNHR